MRSKVSGEFNLWSAASSSGQEIYSIIIGIKEFERNNHKKISSRFYASDISKDILRRASSGIFSMEDIERLDKNMIRRYFLEGRGDQNNNVKVIPELTKKILFFHLNLMDESYIIPQMDVIFLRNVIIYFDRATQERFLERLCRCLRPGGYLFMGHSETLSGMPLPLKQLAPAVYQKN